MEWEENEETEITGNAFKTGTGSNNVNNHMTKSINVQYCSKPFIIFIIVIMLLTRFEIGKEKKNTNTKSTLPGPKLIKIIYPIKEGIIFAFNFKELSILVY